MKAIFALLLFPVLVSAQINGTVSDSISGKPVPYASIWVLKKNTGATAEANGNFNLQTKEKDTLAVQAIGYANKTVIAGNNMNIQLKQIPIQLSEIVIKERKKQTNVLIGDYKNKSGTMLCSGLMQIFAKKFPYKSDYQETPFVKSATIFTENKLKSATIKLRIFKVGSDGNPAEDLVNEPIIITIKGGSRKTEVDLSKYNISMPESGIFAGVEWIVTSANAYKSRESVKGQREKKDVTYYQPSMAFHFTNREYTYMQGAPGKWNFQKMVSQSNERFITEPAINLTLTD